MVIQVQRRARIDKKAFFSEQCKVVEETERMGETRHLFKKIGDIEGTFHARLGTTKDKNCKELTEAEEINKRWQDYTEELYKRVLNVQITTMVWSFTSDILECEIL